MSKTLYDKLWDEHVVTAEGDGTATIYIDRHLMHEVTLSLIHISEPTRP